jgi:hypothetical protein
MTRTKYKYFSKVEEVHCVKSDCPGSNCLCVLGENNTFYLNGTVGE